MLKFFPADKKQITTYYHPLNTKIDDFLFRQFINQLFILRFGFGEFMGRLSFSWCSLFCILRLALIICLLLNAHTLNAYFYKQLHGRRYMEQTVHMYDIRRATSDGRWMFVQLPVRRYSLFFTPLLALIWNQIENCFDAVEQSDTETVLNISIDFISVEC